MRYRRVTYQYTISTRAESARSAVAVEPLSWRPSADLVESATEIRLVVELAGVAEDDIEILLFENAMVIQGRRDLPVSPADGVFRAAEIRHGPFRLELALPPTIDHRGVTASFDRGLLSVSLPRRDGG